MDNFILNRCCGNCEWSITSDMENKIIEENNYDDENYDGPKVGDCSLGRTYDENYLCEEHQYISEGLNTYAFYDDKYLGPGFFVVSEYYDYIIRFLKLYRLGTYGNYSYGVKTYEIDFSNNKYNNILFDISKSNDEYLYNVFKLFVERLNGDIIQGIGNNSFVYSDINKNSVSINFGNNLDKNNGYIDLFVDKTCDYTIYNTVSLLFRDLAAFTMNKKNARAYSKVRLLFKK